MGKASARYIHDINNSFFSLVSSFSFILCEYKDSFLERVTAGVYGVLLVSLTQKAENLVPLPLELQIHFTHRHSQLDRILPFEHPISFPLQFLEYIVWHSTDRGKTAFLKQAKFLYAFRNAAAEVKQKAFVLETATTAITILQTHTTDWLLCHWMHWGIGLLAAIVQCL